MPCVCVCVFASRRRVGLIMDDRLARTTVHDTRDEPVTVMSALGLRTILGTARDHVYSSINVMLLLLYARTKKRVAGMDAHNSNICGA